MSPKPDLELAFVLRADLGEVLDLGQTPRGVRRIIPILGGAFEGPSIRGRVLPGGADWQLIRGDAVTEIHARYALQTDSGELIYVQNPGIRHGPSDVMKRLNAGEVVDPSLYYFRSVPKFETAASGCAWLMRSIFVCCGERYPREVRLGFWRVL